MTTKNTNKNPYSGKKRKGTRKGKLVSFNPSLSKWRGVYYDFATVGTGWTLFQPLGFDQGLDYHERIGNIVMLDSFEWDLNFRASVTDGNDCFRWILAKAYNPDITSASLPNTSEPVNPFLFQLLHEERVACYSIPSSSTEGSGVVQKRSVGRLSLRVLVLFNGPADTDITSNKVVFAMDSDSGAVPNPTIHGWIRVYFHSVL